MRLLDVGCGPGPITIDLAARVAPGKVVGIDRERAVITEAGRLLQAGSPANVEFRAGDVYPLDLGDESFDVVRAHQVLQHLTDPVAALVEMRRVLRPGGILAVRDSDYGGFNWAPSDRLLDRWMQLYHDVCRRNGADGNAGRYLVGWVRAAGFRRDRAEQLNVDLRRRTGPRLVGRAVGRAGVEVLVRPAGGRIRAEHPRGTVGDLEIVAVVGRAGGWILRRPPRRTNRTARVTLTLVGRAASSRPKRHPRPRPIAQRSLR